MSALKEALRNLLKASPPPVLLNNDTSQSVEDFAIDVRDNTMSWYRERISDLLGFDQPQADPAVVVAPDSFWEELRQKLNDQLNEALIEVDALNIRVNELLSANNAYLEEARSARRELTEAKTVNAVTARALVTLREALEFYADEENGPRTMDPRECAITDDMGVTAEQALQDVFGVDHPADQKGPLHGFDPESLPVLRFVPLESYPDQTADQPPPFTSDDLTTLHHLLSNHANSRSLTTAGQETCEALLTKLSLHRSRECEAPDQPPLEGLTQVAQDLGLCGEVDKYEESLCLRPFGHTGDHGRRS